MQGASKARHSWRPLLRLPSLYDAQEPDCNFKHSDSDIKDCNMYKLGFCVHGPNCRFRHLKLPAPPPPPESAHLTVTRPGRPGFYEAG